MSTHHYAVFGHPIGHSKSPLIHEAFAKQTQQDMSYRAILAPKDGIIESLADFFSDDNASGCNITLPFKQQAMPFVDQISEAAKLAGAINTIVKQQDGSFIGDNTDGVGLVNDLLQHEVELTDQRILLIGAGGAARGAVFPLLQQDPKHLVISNRTMTKAQSIVDEVQDPRVSAVPFPELNQYQFDIIINSTAASLSGELPAVPEESITSAKVCYDMMYSQEPTAFNQWAAKLGVNKTIDGLGMLVEQAAQSFYLWRGVRPNTQAVLIKVRESISN